MWFWVSPHGKWSKNGFKKHDFGLIFAPNATANYSVICKGRRLIFPLNNLVTSLVRGKGGPKGPLEGPKGPKEGPKGPQMPSAGARRKGA